MRTITLPRRSLSSRGEGHDPKCLVVVLRVCRFQNGESASHCEARGHNQHVLGETGVLRISHLVQNMPGNDHRHDHRFTRPRGHLGAQPAESAAVTGNLYPNPCACRSFRQPNQRLGRLELAEEEPAALELFLVRPVLQQPLGDRRDPWIARVSPLLHSWPNLVDQWDFNEHAGVVEGRGVPRRYQIARRPAARLPPELSRLPDVAPVLLWLSVGLVDDESVYGGLFQWVAFRRSASSI